MLNPRASKRERRHLQKLQKRQQKKRHRNWFLILLALFFWFTLAFTIIYIDPDLIKDIPVNDTYTPFLIQLFLAIYPLELLITKSHKRSLLYTSALVTLLFLRIKGFGNLFNALIIVGIVLTFEYFYIEYQDMKSKKNPMIKSNHD